MQQLVPAWRGDLHSLCIELILWCWGELLTAEDSKGSLLWSMWRSKRTWPWANSRKHRNCCTRTDLWPSTLGHTHIWKENAYSQNAFGHIRTDIQLCRIVGHSLNPFDAHTIFPKAREQEGRVCLRRALAGFFFSEDRFNTLSAFILSRPLFLSCNTFRNGKKSILALLCTWPLKILPDLLAPHRWTWLF